jgi:hypothetical protein
MLGCLLAAMSVSHNPSLQQLHMLLSKLAASAATRMPSYSSRCHSVFLNCCLVAVNQQGTCVVMGPAAGLPQLHSVHPAFLALPAVTAAGVQLFIRGSNIAGHCVRVRYGKEMRLLDMTPVAAECSCAVEVCDGGSCDNSSSSSSSSSGDLWSVQVPPEVFAGGEGVLTVAIHARQRISSQALPVSVLAADAEVVEALQHL